MRQDTESFLLLLRQHADNPPSSFQTGRLHGEGGYTAEETDALRSWFAANEERIAGVMDTVLSARGDDAGRFIGGARKDRGMFAQMFLNAGVDPTQALAQLEAQGGDVAFKAITRDKLIPKPVPSALRELGDNPGAAYAKTVLYGYITPRPYNSAKARERYVAAAQAVSEVFATPYASVNDLLNALMLRYYVGIVKDDPNGILLKDTEVMALLPPGTDSWKRSSTAATVLKKETFINAFGNSTIFFNDKPSPYYRRESEEEKKERMSVFSPLGPRLLDAVDSTYVDDKKAWYTDRQNAYKYSKDNDWGWAGGATTEGEERVTPLYREDVLPPPDCAQMKAEGDDPRAAYLYAWAYMHLLPKKSKPTKQGREDYQLALEHFDHLLADRSSLLSLMNTLYPRRHFSGGTDYVVPAYPVPPALEKTLQAFLNQDFYPPISPVERREQAISLLSEELGVKVASYFPGVYSVRGSVDKPYYYYIDMPEDQRLELAKERQRVGEALKRVDTYLFDLLEGGMSTKKIDAAVRKESWRAVHWHMVERLCEAIQREVESRAKSEEGSGGGGRFVLPSRGVEGPRVGPPVPGPHTSESIQRTTGLYGIEYGNWMNDADRDAVNKSVAEAMHDLAHVLGVPLAAVSLGKRLALALGARGSGRFAAHYEPWSKAINMTRTKGSGALAHEWGHALDHWIADKGQSRVVGGSLTAFFGSMLDGAGGLTGVDVSPEERKAINDAMMGVTDIIIAGKKGYNEARVRRWENENPAPPYTYNTRDAYNEWSAQRREFLEKLSQNAMTNNMLRFAEQAGDYWQRNEEMFARAWESYVNDKLENEGRHNGYLVRGTKKTSEAYPQGDQRARLYVVFDALNDALRPVLRRIATRPNGRGSKPRPVLRKPR